MSFPPEGLQKAHVPFGRRTRERPASKPNSFYSAQPISSRAFDFRKCPKDALIGWSWLRLSSQLAQ